MPKILLLEDNELNRDMFSRRFTSGVEWLIPLRAYGRAEFVREIARLLGASAACEVPPGEERPR
jgi:hypothetical protein